MKERAKKHYAKGLPGWPMGKKVPLAASKRVAQKMLDDLITAAERGQAGLADRFQEHRTKPIAEHLDAYGKVLLAKGNTAKYVRLARGRIHSLCDGCGFRFLAEVEPTRVLEWLTELRKDQTPPALPPGRETFTARELAALLEMRADTLRDNARRRGLPKGASGKPAPIPRAAAEELLARACRGASVQTANYYISALKGFLRWCVRDRRLADNPVAHLQGGNAQLDRRHDRRELAVEELMGTLDAARASAVTFRGLAGADRYHLYLTACGTGFRAEELATLLPESFALDAAPPTATLPRAATKNRRGAVQPLPPGVADALRGYLKGKPAGRPVWPGNWYKVAAEVLRADLEAAGVPYVVPGPDGPLFADFHALRHTYVSMLTRSGLTVKQAQTLARHSKAELTIGRYSHTALPELGEAVGRLPALAPAGGDGAGAVEMTTVPTADLEALQALAATLVALLGALGCTVVVPRVVPDLATAGDGPGRSDTEAPKPVRKAG